MRSTVAMPYSLPDLLSDSLQLLQWYNPFLRILTRSSVRMARNTSPYYEPIIRATCLVYKVFSGCFRPVLNPLV